MLPEMWRRATAWMLLLAVALVTGPVTAGSDTLFTGKVLESDPPTPRSGVVVSLVGSSPDDVYRAEPTGTDGAFRLEGAPAGSYRVIAETETGAYLAAQDFELIPDTNRPVTLTLTAVVPDEEGTSGTSGGRRRGLPAWAKWTIVGGIVLLAAWGIDSVTEDEEEPPASPID